MFHLASTVFQFPPFLPASFPVFLPSFLSPLLLSVPLPFLPSLLTLLSLSFAPSPSLPLTSLSPSLPPSFFNWKAFKGDQLPAVFTIPCP